MRVLLVHPRALLATMALIRRRSREMNLLCVRHAQQASTSRLLDPRVASHAPQASTGLERGAPHQLNAYPAPLVTTRIQLVIIYARAALRAITELPLERRHALRVPREGVHSPPPLLAPPAPLAIIRARQAPYPASRAPLASTLVPRALRAVLRVPQATTPTQARLSARPASRARSPWPPSTNAPIAPRASIRCCSPPDT